MSLYNDNDYTNYYNKKESVSSKQITLNGIFGF